MKPFPNSIPPLDNNSIMAGFIYEEVVDDPQWCSKLLDIIESEGDVNPIGVVRSKPFMQFDPTNPDYDGAESEADNAQ